MSILSVITRARMQADSTQHHIPFLRFLGGGSFCAAVSVVSYGLHIAL